MSLRNQGRSQSARTVLLVKYVVGGEGKLITQG